MRRSATVGIWPSQARPIDLRFGSWIHWPRDVLEGVCLTRSGASGLWRCVIGAIAPDSRPPTSRQLSDLEKSFANRVFGAYLRNDESGAFPFRFGFGAP